MPLEPIQYKTRLPRPTLRYAATAETDPAFRSLHHSVVIRIRTGPCFHVFWPDARLNAQGNPPSKVRHTRGLHPPLSQTTFSQNKPTAGAAALLCRWAPQPEGSDGFCDSLHIFHSSDSFSCSTEFLLQGLLFASVLSCEAV